MQPNIKFPWFTFVLMISFASVNAVLFTPALPDIANFFAISEAKAEYSVLTFLFGYALGQLIYGPLAQRFGRKMALVIGIGIQILASLGCILSSSFYSYSLLVISRFILALGAGVGLKMTFTLVNEWYSPQQASEKISYLMLAFAITPGLAVALGGYANVHFGWESCFLAGLIYGLFLLTLVLRLPIAITPIDKQAFNLSHLGKAYSVPLKNASLITGALLMGCATCFIYVFAACAPFIAMNLLGMGPEQYGVANMIPSIGLIGGSLCSAKFTKTKPLLQIIKIGLCTTVAGVMFMLIALSIKIAPVIALFVPMVMIYFGLSLLLANASSLALSRIEDKSHGSAVINFMNMGLATVVVLGAGLFPMKALLLPLIFAVICIFMIVLYRILLFKSEYRTHECQMKS